MSDWEADSCDVLWCCYHDDVMKTCCPTVERCTSAAESQSLSHSVHHSVISPVMTTSCSRVADSMTSHLQWNYLAGDLTTYLNGCYLAVESVSQPMLTHCYQAQPHNKTSLTISNTCNVTRSDLAKAENVRTLAACELPLCPNIVETGMKLRPYWQWAVSAVSLPFCFTALARTRPSLTYVVSIQDMKLLCVVCGSWLDWTVHNLSTRKLSESEASNSVPLTVIQSSLLILNFALSIPPCNCLHLTNT